jgi:hypothetical protein
MKTDYIHNQDYADFWAYFTPLWVVECTDDPIPTTEHDQLPVRSGVIIVPQPEMIERHEILDQRHIGANGHFDPDETQKIVVTWGYTQ